MKKIVICINVFLIYNSSFSQKICTRSIAKESKHQYDLLDVFPIDDKSFATVTLLSSQSSNYKISVYNNCNVQMSKTFYSENFPPDYFFTRRKKIGQTDVIVSYLKGFAIKDRIYIFYLSISQNSKKVTLMCDMFSRSDAFAPITTAIQTRPYEVYLLSRKGVEFTTTKDELFQIAVSPDQTKIGIFGLTSDAEQVRPILWPFEKISNGFSAIILDETLRVIENKECKIPIDKSLKGENLIKPFIDNTGNIYICGNTTKRAITLTRYQAQSNTQDQLSTDIAADTKDVIFTNVNISEVYLPTIYYNIRNNSIYVGTICRANGSSAEGLNLIRFDLDHWTFYNKFYPIDDNLLKPLNNTLEQYGFSRYNGSDFDSYSIVVNPFDGNVFWTLGNDFNGQVIFAFDSIGNKKWSCAIPNLSSVSYGYEEGWLSEYRYHNPILVSPGEKYLNIILPINGSIMEIKKTVGYYRTSISYNNGTVAAPIKINEYGSSDDYRFYDKRSGWITPDISYFTDYNSTNNNYTIHKLEINHEN